MRRLFDHIEDIHIKGNPTVLTEAVTAMDASLQNIAAWTEQLAGFLLKYSSTNKGIQYAKAVDTVVKLSAVLYDASVEVNEMQNEVVRYQNKVFRYEDLSETGSVYNKFLVQKVTVSADETAVHFGRTEMTALSNTLKSYIDIVLHYAHELYNKKEQLAAVWMDSQYQTFSAFIDEICKMIEQALKVLDEYRMHLDEKLRELG